MKCVITPCTWFWCKTNKDCYLHKLECKIAPVVNISKPKKKDRIPRKQKVNRKQLKHKLTPIIKGINKYANIYQCAYCPEQI